MSQPRRNARTSQRSATGLWLAAAVVIALLVAGGWYWKSRQADRAQSAYRSTPVEHGNIRVVISATGTLSAISTVTVGSQISGQVTDVLVDFNSPVKKDQVLARIDPSSYEAQIEQGAASIASARALLHQYQASLKNAELDYQRKQDLGSRQLVAQSDVDLARAALDQTRAQVAAAQAQIRQQTAATQNTRVNLDRTVIRSPVDGVVLTRTIEPGQTVAASLQAPELFTIAEDLAQMKIELAVDESDIGQVKVGQSVSFTADAFADRQFRGKVEQVRLSATTTNNVVTYPVVVTVDNSDGTLLPGLTVNAEIEVSKRDDVLKVANAALRFKPAEDSLLAQAAPAPAAHGDRGGSGMSDDLARVAAQMKLSSPQQAAFDAALASIKQRQQARQAQAPTAGNRMFGDGPGGGPRAGSTDGADNVQAQARQRMKQRWQQDFADFRGGLDPVQQKTWDAALARLLNARRSTVYQLLEGQPQAISVRLGASDGTSTEVSGGGLQAGDQLVTGERAQP